MEPRRHGSHGNTDVGARRLLLIIANACLLAISVSGAGLLVWWVLEFHPSNRQLWMVPLGLIMACTPVVMWFSVLASDDFHRLELPSAMPGSPVASLAPEKGLKCNVSVMV